MLLLCYLIPVTIVSSAEKNVIFFITDDESPTLGCYGDPVAVTPHIDALAQDGVRFTRAFATTASCSASRSVVLSGLHNHYNGQYGHTHHFHKFTSFPAVIGLSLPRAMARAGYRTGQIGKYHVAPEEVFHFEKYIPGNGRNAVSMANNCREFINDKTDKRPFFLYFATTDPHRGGGKDQSSKQELKPDLFGNRADNKSWPGINEVRYDPQQVPIPHFLPDTSETREELAQYYQSVSRIDQGLGQLVKILKEAKLYDKTMIIFTSDHGMAFSGGKTTTYEGGLVVPFVVRNPYIAKRGFTTNAMISHIDITPAILDFAGGLNDSKTAPKSVLDWRAYYRDKGVNQGDNLDGRHKFDAYHGKSWLPVLEDPESKHWDTIFASHTFHEIQMYYPMRVVRDDQYKLIWNIAHGLPYPFASDLWAASSWQAQFRKGLDSPYGQKSVHDYIHRAKFELFDIRKDPHEKYNLADDPRHEKTLEKYKQLLKEHQKRMHDPWIMKWDYE
ncbi:MAG: sulfatase [Planctomycetota bacterium]|nr:sulfatase [Planctomycetota bacterium]